MSSKISKFRLVRCPKCLKLLAEFTDIPVYKCGACSTLLHAKDLPLTGESITSRSGNSSIGTLLNTSEQSIPTSSSLCYSPSSNVENTLHQKELLYITCAERDECKQDESIDKIKDFPHKDEEKGNQQSVYQLSFTKSRSKNQQKSSLNPLRHASALEDNVIADLNSQTSPSSHAYNASISSIDDTSMRTYRLQRVPKVVSNRPKEREEASVEAEHKLNKIPLKSRTDTNEITDERNACENRKLQSLRYILPAYKRGASVESFPLSRRVEFEKTRASLLREPAFTSTALRSQRQDRIELHPCCSHMTHTNYHQCSLHPPPRFCCSDSKCSFCVYNICSNYLNEEVEKLSMKGKIHQARRRCRPISNGAPFIICRECFKLLLLPMDFLVTKRRSNKLRCGACSRILVLQFPAIECAKSNNFSGAKICPQVLQSSNSAGKFLKPGTSLQVRNCEQELLPPLHQLMGYFSATEVLYQVTDVDEGYESSEPAMPDSYRRYEEERHKNLLLQYSVDEA